MICDGRERCTENYCSAMRLSLRFIDCLVNMLQCHPKFLFYVYKIEVGKANYQAVKLEGQNGNHLNCILNNNHNHALTVICVCF